MTRQHPPLVALACAVLLLAAAALAPLRAQEAAPAAAHPEGVKSPEAPAAPPTALGRIVDAHAIDAGTAAAAKDHETAPAAKAAPPAKTSTMAKTVAESETKGMLKLGPSLTDRGDYEAAEIAFRQVMNTPGVAVEDLKSALLGLARMHRKQGALTKAAAIYERYLKDYPGDERSPDALLELGRTLRGMGIHKLAINRFYSVLNSTLKLDGDGFTHYQLVAKTAQFEIAQTHFEAGEFAEANKFFTRLRLLDLAPADRARAHFMSACALRLQGDLEGAVTTLRTFIEQSPEDENIPEARYLLAVTLRELHRPQEAFAATLELLRSENSHSSADQRRWAYWQRRTGNQLANDFFEAGDTLNAQAIYTGLLSLSTAPGWRLPLTYQIALCYERLGHLDNARGCYKEIVETAGPTPANDLVELTRMANWRLEHLGWREKVDQQISTFFTTTTGKQASALPAAPGKAAATP